MQGTLPDMRPQVPEAAASRGSGSAPLSAVRQQRANIDDSGYLVNRILLANNMLCGISLKQS